MFLLSRALFPFSNKKDSTSTLLCITMLFVSNSYAGEQEKKQVGEFQSIFYTYLDKSTSIIIAMELGYPNGTRVYYGPATYDKIKEQYNQDSFILDTAMPPPAPKGDQTLEEAWTSLRTRKASRADRVRGGQEVDAEDPGPQGK